MTERPIVELRSVGKQYTSRPNIFARSRRTTVLHDISMEMRQGEIVGLVGQSGSGKSTIAKLIVGLVKPSSGEITVSGAPPLPVGKRGPRTHQAQMVFQDVYASLNPIHTVRHHLVRALRASGSIEDPAAADEGATRLLERVGLVPAERFLDRRPNDLSGGQRQRVGIARALAADPRVIVMDEPISMLDVSIRLDVLRLIRGLSDDADVSTLYITHDLVSAGYICDRIIVLYRGEIVEQGPSAELLRNPQHPYTAALKAALPAVDEALGSAQG
jgi:peptide/nickel transport system ATP-binding protein